MTSLRSSQRLSNNPSPTAIPRRRGPLPPRDGEGEQSFVFLPLSASGREGGRGYQPPSQRDSGAADSSPCLRWPRVVAIRNSRPRIATRTINQSGRQTSFGGSVAPLNSSV